MSLQLNQLPIKIQKWLYSDLVSGELEAIVQRYAMPEGIHPALEKTIHRIALKELLPEETQIFLAKEIKADNNLIAKISSEIYKILKPMESDFELLGIAIKKIPHDLISESSTPIAPNEAQKPAGLNFGSIFKVFSGEKKAKELELQKQKQSESKSTENPQEQKKNPNEPIVIYKKPPINS